MTRVEIERSQFPDEKILNIKADNYFDAFLNLASQTKSDIDNVLNYYKNNHNYENLLKRAKEHLGNVLEIRTKLSHIF